MDGSSAQMTPERVLMCIKDIDHPYEEVRNKVAN
jgi:hypothetical protein